MGHGFFNFFKGGHLKKSLLKNTFKVTLQYLFNVFILFNTVSYIKKTKNRPKHVYF